MRCLIADGGAAAVLQQITRLAKEQPVYEALKLLGECHLARGDTQSAVVPFGRGYRIDRPCRACRPAGSGSSGDWAQGRGTSDRQASSSWGSTESSDVAHRATGQLTWYWAHQACFIVDWTHKQLAQDGQQGGLWF